MSLFSRIRALRVFARLRELKPFDMLANLWKGDPDETISGTMGRLRAEEHDPVAVDVCKVLDAIEQDHCAGAYANEEGGRLPAREAVEKIIADAEPKP